jgi:hypothetical protein
MRTYNIDSELLLGLPVDVSPFFICSCNKTAMHTGSMFSIHGKLTVRMLDFYCEVLDINLLHAQTIYRLKRFTHKDS